ncbi:hypothetical protein [Synechocystis sp. LKSZ1]|uniref:hypothetical protein n=1 Tax=Synechocystis sp. LKSZ1 TaxID=3144951 RepID=UPI00336BD348
MPCPSPARLTLLAGSLVSLFLMSAQPTPAQTHNSTTNDGFQSNEQNVNGFGTSGFDPLSLIHNANFSRSRNSSDFADDTNQNLNKAAQEFKRQQQQQLQQLSAPSAVPVTNSPASNTP